MSDYPEHDKLSVVQEQTQAIGEFLEWLASEHVQLRVWREDLTDTRPTPPECEMRRSRDNPRPCDHAHDDGDHSVMYWMRHCKHWQAEDITMARCCYCGLGRIYEVHGIKDWVPEPRTITGLLADWAGIRPEQT